MIHSDQIGHDAGKASRFWQRSSLEHFCPLAPIYGAGPGLDCCHSILYSKSESLKMKEIMTGASGLFQIYELPRPETRSKRPEELRIVSYPTALSASVAAPGLTSRILGRRLPRHLDRSSA